MTAQERDYLALRSLAAGVIGNGGALRQAEADALQLAREALPECPECGDPIIQGCCESAGERWHSLE